MPQKKKRKNHALFFRGCKVQPDLYIQCHEKGDKLFFPVLELVAECPAIIKIQADAQSPFSSFLGKEIAPACRNIRGEGVRLVGTDIQRCKQIPKVGIREIMLHFQAGLQVEPGIPGRFYSCGCRENLFREGKSQNHRRPEEYPIAGFPGTRGAGPPPKGSHHGFVLA